MSNYLAFAEKLRLFGIVLAATGGAYLAKRDTLRSDLPMTFRAIMGNFSDDATALDADLTLLNETERLRDGKIPLAIYLTKFLYLFGTVATDSDWVREIASRVSGAATDAPDVALPTQTEIEEATVHQDDTLELAFLRMGLTAAMAVAKLEVPQLQNGAPVVVGGTPLIHLGTGFLVASGLLLTNHHVINARRKGEPPATADDFKRQAAGATVRFDYDDLAIAGTIAPVLELVHHDAGLDYALLRIDAPGRLPLTLARDLPEPPQGHGAVALNIIQHPNGDPKRIAIRNNLTAGADDKDLRYFTDTLGGSSGSPVLDDSWRVIGLHRGTRLAPGVKFQGKDAVYINVGTRISAVVDFLKAVDIELHAE